MEQEYKWDASPDLHRRVLRWALGETSGGSEHPGGVERAEGADRTGGIECAEGAERTSGAEYAEGAERSDGAECTGGAERTEGVERTGDVECAEGSERTSGVERTEMDAQYFDTPESSLAQRQAALRMRRENQTLVCCLKLRGAESADGLHAREEYETPAASLAEGLAALPQAGAPAELCAWLQTLPLAETCRISFVRKSILLQRDGASAELALDRGHMSACGNTAPLCEIELELKSGTPAAFRSMAEELARQFQLQPQPLSKLARAKALARR